MTDKEINYCNELGTQLAHRACLELSNLIDQTTQQGQWYKYDIGGKNLHRGWYCPSIIYDIVIGNASRGRLVKKPQPQTLPSFRYCFNANGTLLRVDEYFNGKIAASESLLYENETIKGLTITSDNQLLRYSEEQYSDAILTQYSYIDYNPCDKTPYFLHCEKYKLEDNRLICWFAEYEMMTKSGWSHNYIFTLDEQGVIQSYHIEGEDPKGIDHSERVVSRNRNISRN